MRLLITANIAPFLRGGADYHIEGLVAALRRHGHEVELIRFPFKFHPPEAVTDLMEYCGKLDLAMPNGIAIDRVISLQFPGYGIAHPDHVVWLMHQHRAVYELYDQQPASAALAHMRDAIHAFDNQHLGRARCLYANSRCVAGRLQRYNKLHAEPLYHPPAFAEQYYHAPAEPYIFCPSRLERLKRQDLLIEALCHIKSPLNILIAGEGGQRDYYEALVERHHLGNRVRFLGHISEAEKLAFYAHASAVFFGPFDEDYGYITLEAMLASKPVITCTDSGGPLEFVEDGTTGWISPPEPRALADILDYIANHPAETAERGRNGRAAYALRGIGWDSVVAALAAPRA